MKRFVLILALSALLAWGAAAEGIGLTVWSNRADDCYHSDKYCGNPEGERYALSEAAAIDFGKQPCPDCVTLDPYNQPRPDVDLEPVDAEITCAERSGTWVFRFPAALLDSVALGNGEGPEASAALTAVFGENLTDALEATLAAPAGDGLVLSLRTIEGDAWAVVRPKKSFKAKRPLSWVAEHIAVDIFNPGVYTVTGVSEVQTYKPPKHVTDLDRAYSRSYDGASVDVYSEDGMSIAVIRMDADMDALTGVIRLGPSDIPVTGYISKDRAVFCCPLTDAEVEVLRETAPAFIPKDEISFTEDAFRPIATLPPDVFAEPVPED